MLGKLQPARVAKRAHPLRSAAPLGALGRVAPVALLGWVAGWDASLCVPNKMGVYVSTNSASPENPFFFGYLVGKTEKLSFWLYIQPAFILFLKVWIGGV